jgi:hypothetical protein
MQKFHRRHVLASLGAMGGSALLTGCGRQLSGNPEASAASSVEFGRTVEAVESAAPAKAAVEQLAVASRDWTYRPLDPEAVGQLAYDIYPKGSCMYSVFGSVIMQLADKVGEPFRSFPIDMMRFGAVGVGGWGSVCGVVNGCAALIGLFHSGDDIRKKRDDMIADVCLWYESAPLPTFQPDKPALDVALVSNVSGSVLCHVSSGMWCKAAGCDAVSPERRERCRRLSAEGAMKVVQLLNEDGNSSAEFFDITPEVHSCIECHGKDGQRDSLGSMNCMPCHQFDTEHP